MSTRLSASVEILLLMRSNLLCLYLYLLLEKLQGWRIPVGTGTMTTNFLGNKVEEMSRIILAQDAEMWLLNLTSHKINEFVPVHLQGTDDAQSQETIQWAYDRFRNNKANQLTQF
jgi:hypothetical protein